MTTNAPKNGLPLNLHAFLPLSQANGPGARAVVWTQGCRRRCPGCCNPLTHSHRARILVAPSRLADRILAARGIEGLTVSGGEPFEQAAAVAELCCRVRRAGLSVMVFTGRVYEKLRRSRRSEVQRLLRQIDILVDGPFIQRLADRRLRWRGSRNQRALFLTGRYGPNVLSRFPSPEVEAQLSAGPAVRLTGFPEPADMSGLAARLRQSAGIVLEPSCVIARAGRA